MILFLLALKKLKVYLFSITFFIILIKKLKNIIISVNKIK